MSNCDHSLKMFKTDNTNYDGETFDEFFKEKLAAEEIVVTCRECKTDLFKRARVGSSNLFSVGVFEDDLVVEFLQGYPTNIKTKLYVYPNKAHKLNALLKAHSIGEYFADEVKAEAGNDFYQIR